MNTTNSGRRSAALVISLIAAALVAVAMASPAQAAAYRYWSYWLGASGTWVAAPTGPGDHVLVDEDVQGWRFGITTEAPAQGPDNDPDFGALCPQLATDGPVDGQVRVAVVIDSGFVADAPDGESPPADVVSCVTLAEGSTGNQALAAAGTPIDQGGLVCGINGYPADECGAEVPDAVATSALEAAQSEQPNPAVVTTATTAAAPTTTDDDTSSSLGLFLGAAIVAVLVAAAVLIRRRRSTDGA